MIEIRPFKTLGKANHGWLDTSYHFSFSDYHDPARLGWGNLRVWNDDWIAPGSGFPPHPHRDMEIVTYVRKGAISHRDSLGNEGRTAAGDVQVMSAGNGITHAEYNREDETTELFQIWIMPERTGHAPGWSQRKFPKRQRNGQWITLASNTDHEGSGEVLPINADARVMAAALNEGDSLTLDLIAERHAYMVPIGGSVQVNGQIAHSRDGVAITDETCLSVAAITPGVELLLVDSH